MRVAVLGSTGEMGARVAALLSERGHEVIPVSRATGVDVLTGRGLDEALTGVHTVVDCLNTEFRNGALLPKQDGIQDERPYADWLREHSTHAP